jgi:type I restriction enzyme S subunit
MRWKQVKLGDVVDVRHGFAFAGEYFRDNPPGDILLTPGNFAIGGGFKNDKLKYYDGPVPSGFVLDPRDLLVTMTDLSKDADTLGYPAFVPNTVGVRYLHNQRLGRVFIKPNAPIAKGYLYYVLRTKAYRDEVLASATGTTVKHTSPNRILSFRCLLPPLAEQRAIADVLGALDDKIELNRRINETLETTAQAIFKSWFVDFDPRSSGHTSQPRSWRKGTFADIASVGRDSIKPGEFPHELFDHYSIPAFDERHLPVSEAGEAIKSNKFIVPHDAVLLSKLNPRIPRIWMPDVVSGRRSICSTEFLVLQHTQVSREYLFGLCTSDAFLQEFTTMVTGTSGSHQRVKPEFLEAIEVSIPDAATMERFTELVAPIHGRVALNLRENQTLSALCDTLLPKLLSGEVRVKQAEKMMETSL